MTEYSVVSLVNKTISSLDDTIKLKLRDWGKVVQLIIDEVDYFIDFKRNELVLKQGITEEYDFKLTSSSDVFFQILQRELNPVDAVVSGEVAIEGSLTDALEFSEILMGT